MGSGLGYGEDVSRDSRVENLGIRSLGDDDLATGKSCN